MSQVKGMLLIVLLPLQSISQQFTAAEVARWKEMAQKVTITRDNWGIPHIYGQSDADAVFGLLYAQCEDDFKRVEMNYIEKFGRLAEVKGSSKVFDDLYVMLVIDSSGAKADYLESPAWLKKLLNAFADGVNFYLYTHPETRPILLQRFEPWYPLLWTDGSIGAISTGNVTVAELQAFYTGGGSVTTRLPTGPIETGAGSNGFAIAPSRTATGNAMLYINPHVTFYFRPEVHVASEEGLNVYGAVTWGQFFVYQGFNEFCGWMHTSSDVDVSDMYAENIVTKPTGLVYEYQRTERSLEERKIAINVKTDSGVETNYFKAWFTHHGPVMTRRNGKYISVKSMNRSMKSLVQSWLRTKAKGLADFKKTMALRANTSNNTVFADNKGNIAYWHGDFVPRRDTAYDWARPVDGSIAATEWQGLHELNELVHVYNPASGWIQNCNSTPFTVSGKSSPKKQDYPSYMAPDGENFRGITAAKRLNGGHSFTIDQLIATGYDNYLSAFEILVPALLSSFDSAIKHGDSSFAQLSEPVKLLRQWDYRSSESSVATTLAIEWAEKLSPRIRQLYDQEGQNDQVQLTRKFAASAGAKELLPPLLATVNDLNSRFGNWRIAWGELNRFQRVSDDIEQRFDDRAPSTGVGYASSQWGMLPSFSSRYYPGTTRRYGIGGNSFVCAVEFGKKIKAKSLLAGGQSGDPASPHFFDQAEMYAKGKFKDILFYRADVMKHAVKTYRPGVRP